MKGSYKAIGFIAIAVALFISLPTVVVPALNRPASGGSPAACTSVPQSSTLIADWAYRYGNISSMKSDADAVIVGEITGSTAFVGGRNCQLIFTRYTIAVKVGLKGLAAGNTVTVVQTGGVLNNSKQEVLDDPLMSVGDRVVLFLRFDRERGLYGILGGPQGRFLVKNQLVYSLNVLYPDRSIDLAWTVAGQPEASFVSQIS